MNTNNALAIPSYRILEKVGQGGMSLVYKAERSSDGQLVAIKVLRPRGGNVASQNAALLQEAKLAMSVSHPNVIAVLDQGAVKDCVYVVLELVEGGDTWQLLKSQGGRIEEIQALEIIRDACKGLTAVHASGLVHRDIKPQNLFITAEGVAKLADLGIARKAGDEHEEQGNVTVGTPSYMSPEQAMGTTVLDITADIYSLGATLYALVCGKPPYLGASTWDTISQVLQQPAPDPRAHGVSEPVAGLIECCLARKREHRFQTPDAFLRGIRQAITQVRKEKARDGSAATSARSSSGSLAAVGSNSSDCLLQPEGDSCQLRLPLAVGSVVGDFRIRAHHGVTATGALYEAVATTDLTPVLLEVLHPNLSCNNGFCTWLDQHVAALREIETVHASPIVAQGQDGQHLFVASARIPDAQSLLELLRGEGALTINEAMERVIEVARGLDAYHQAGLVHRALHPANIFIAPDGHAVLGCPSLARMDQNDTNLHDDPPAWLVALAHQSPELVLGERIPVTQSDVYSLGALLYTLISGACPHSDENTFTLSHYVITETPLPLRQRTPMVSAELASLVDAALSKSPDQRPTDAATFLLAARRIAHGSPMKAKLRAISHGAALTKSAVEALVSLPDLVDPEDPDLADLERGALRIAMRNQTLNAWRALAWLARSPWIKRKASKVADLLSAMKMVQPTEIIVVGPNEEYTSLGDALLEAPSFAMVMVKPGVYTEPLKLIKPVYLIGVGPCKDIRVDVTGDHALEVCNTVALISGFTLRVLGGDGQVPQHALAVKQGRVVMLNSTIAGTGASTLCVGDIGGKPPPPPTTEDSPQQSSTRRFFRAIKGDNGQPEITNHSPTTDSYKAHVWLGDCRVNGPAICAIVAHTGHAIIEHSQISTGNRCGIDLRPGASCELRECEITRIKGTGILVRGQTELAASACSIHGNQLSGIELRPGADPRFEKCKVHSNGQCGVLAGGERCAGVFEDCEIALNQRSNVAVRQEAQPLFHNCQINKSLHTGVDGLEGGKGRFESCRLDANTKFAAFLAAGSELTFERCHLLHGKALGIQCARNSAGLIADCTFEGSKSESLIIEPGARTVQR